VLPRDRPGEDRLGTTGRTSAPWGAPPIGHRGPHVGRIVADGLQGQTCATPIRRIDVFAGQTGKGAMRRAGGRSRIDGSRGKGGALPRAVTLARRARLVWLPFVGRPRYNHHGRQSQQDACDRQARHRPQPAQSSGSRLSALLLFVDCAVSGCVDTTYDSCIEQVVPRVTKGGTGEGQNRNNRYNRYNRHSRLPLRLW
jgi:hypothetical protein